MLGIKGGRKPGHNLMSGSAFQTLNSSRTARQNLALAAALTPFYCEGAQGDPDETTGY